MIVYLFVRLDRVMRRGGGVNMLKLVYLQDALLFSIYPI